MEKLSAQRLPVNEYGWFSVFLGIISILAGGFALLVWQVHTPNVLTRHLQYPAYGLMLGAMSREIARIARQPVLRVATLGLVLNTEALVSFTLSKLGSQFGAPSGGLLLEGVVVLPLAYAGYRFVVAAARRDAITVHKSLMTERHRVEDGTFRKLR
jgi:hypothetical protein